MSGVSEWDVYVVLCRGWRLSHIGWWPAIDRTKHASLQRDSLYETRRKNHVFFDDMVKVGGVHDSVCVQFVLMLRAQECAKTKRRYIDTEFMPEPSR